MPSADVIIAPRWIVPVEPAGAVLETHALVIGGGRIEALLPLEEACRRYPGRPVLERPAHVLLPGFVNARVQAAMTLARGLPGPAGVRDRRRPPVEVRRITGAFTRDGTDLGLLEMVRNGTTCVADTAFYPEEAAAAAAATGLRACVGTVIHEWPAHWSADAEECIRRAVAVHDRFRGHPLVQGMFAPDTLDAVSDETLRRIRVLADELELPVQVTFGEPADSALPSAQRNPLRRLDDLGLLGAPLAVVHSGPLEPAEIGLLHTRGTSVIHCPEAALMAGVGSFPAAELLAAGVNVALGTGTGDGNNALDPFGSLRTCAQGTLLSPAAVLRMATLGGARALGLADRIGTLEAGKQADLICVDLAAPATWPVRDPVALLVHAACRDQVSDVWVAGEPLLAQHRPTRVDEREIMLRADAWRPLEAPS